MPPPRHLPARIRTLGGRDSPESADLVRARTALDARERRLEESVLALDAYAWQLDRFRDGDNWIGGGYGGAWGPPADRSQDRSHAPLPYETEPEWRLHVALARDMLMRNHLALAARDLVCDFIGTVKVTWVERGEEPGASGGTSQSPLVREVNQAWKEFCEYAEWGEGEEDTQRECLQRVVGEGEATARFFEGDDNSNALPHVRIVDPEFIKTPTGASLNDPWGWGVKTRDRDAAGPEEGICVADTDDPTRQHAVESSEYVRTKINVDRVIKRGVSDFFPCSALFAKVLSIRESLAHNADLLAKLLWWEQFPTATETQVRSMIEAGRDYQRLKAVPGDQTRTTDVTNYERGSIVRTEAGRVVKEPPAAVNTPNLLSVDAAVIRGLGYRFGFPAYFTGESDASFASVLVTGSPFVRRITFRQHRAEAFNKKVAVRFIQFCERSGRLPRGTCQKVKPVTECEQVIIADEQKKSAIFLAEYAAGVASPPAYLRSKGDDPKQVAADIAEWKKISPPAGQQPPSSAQPAPGASNPTATPPGSAGGDGSSPSADPMAGLLGEGKGGVGSADGSFPGRAVELLLLSESEYAELSEADRAGLVKKVITNKAGKKQTVWVRSGETPAAEPEPAAVEPAPVSREPRAVARDTYDMDPAFSATATVHQESIGPEERQALLNYTFISHVDVNRQLRRNPDPAGLSGTNTYAVDAAGKLTGKKIPLADLHRRWKSVYDSSPDWKPPVTVYRGVRLSGVDRAALETAVKECAESGGKKLLRFAGWQSTSVDPAHAANFSEGQPLFEIVAHKAPYISPTRENRVGLSAFPNEGEMILPHNQAYRVIGTATRTIGGALRQVIRLEQVPGTDDQTFAVERPLRKGFLGFGGQKAIRITSNESVEPKESRFAQDTLDGASVVEGGADLTESHLTENFTGTDSHGHHWVNGKQVSAPDTAATPTPASSGTSIPGHDLWRKKLPHPDTVTARPKTKKARAEIGRALQNAWTEARNALTVKYGTRDINDKMTPDESGAENDLHKTLEPIASGNERDGPFDLGPVSDQRYQGYYRAAVQALDKLRASASLPQAGSAPKSESLLLAEADAHGEGEVWQSGKFWYTKRNGKVVRAKNPNAAADTGGEKKPGEGDAEAQALSKKAAETPGELTDAELAKIDAHLRTKSKAELTRIATQINGSGYEGMVAGSSVPELADSISTYVKYRRDTEARGAATTAAAKAEAEKWVASLSSKAVTLAGVGKLIGALDGARLGWHATEAAKEQAIVRVLAAASTDGGTMQEHGMTAPEATRRVYVQGTSLHYPDTPEGRIAAAQTLVAMSSQDWPPALVSATARIIITTQTNSQDPYWRTTYNDPNHVSNATGGDGQIVKYHGEGVGTGTFAHESGHNVARKLWGSTHPDPESEYGKAQKAEEPVSKYGAKSPAEDFAEAVEHYTRYTGRSRLKALFPLKFAALQKILGDTS